MAMKPPTRVSGFPYSVMQLIDALMAPKLVQLPTGDGKTQIVASPTMKTDSSLRTLSLIGKVAEHLKDVHKRQEDNKALFGNTYRWKYDGYVCLFDDGGLISPDYVTTRFPRLLDKHGLRKIRFHDLRHPYVKPTTQISLTQMAAG